MGTTTDEAKPRTSLQRVVTTFGAFQTEAVEAAYGHRGASGWAYVLILVIGACFLIDTTLADIVGVMALVALAVWVGGRR